MEINIRFTIYTSFVDVFMYCNVLNDSNIHQRFYIDVIKPLNVLHLSNKLTNNIKKTTNMAQW